MSVSHYTHGTDTAEQERLTAMNRLLNGKCLSQGAFGPNERVIDFGAGLAQFSRAIAKISGVRVICVERSAEQIREAEAQANAAGESHLIEMRLGDVNAPPIQQHEWGTFDTAHARFLLEHVPDPLSVVNGMVRAVHPGGRTILADDDYATLRLWPEPAGFRAIWQAYQRSYDRHGNDPFVGRRLVQLLQQAGAQPTFNTWVFFGACAGNPDFLPLVRNLGAILAEASADIVAIGIPEEMFQAGLHELSAWAQRPDAALWHAICWAEGRRKSSH
jgi:SAM-dependent methyltransferase